MSRLRRASAPPPPIRFQAGAGWHIKRYLGSRGHLVGTLAAIGGIVLLDTGLTDGILGFIAIGVLYVTGYFVASRPRQTRFGESAARDAPRIAASLDELLAVIRMRVADDIYRRVASIRDGIVFTLDHAGSQNEADPNVYLVRQTAVAYLPEALSAYLALPRPYAERQPIENGRTSHDILLEQLALMDIKTREVAEIVVRRESQQLVHHGRFLAERYHDSSLDVPPGPIIPPPPPPQQPLLRPVDGAPEDSTKRAA